MTKSPQLPNDVDTLKALLIEQNSHIEKIQSDKDKLQIENTRLQEQLNLAIARRYAASSEKIPSDQFRLFDEAELDDVGDDEESVLELTNEENTTTVAEHTRKKKTGRKPLPDSLPRIDVVHDLNEAERVCEHDGKPLDEIGEVISEQLDIIPAKIQVIRHIRKKYACECGKCIKTAPMPNQPIPKSLAAPGLLAHITVSKYQDALPLYRQEQILQRIGVAIPRATLANWTIKNQITLLYIQPGKPTQNAYIERFNRTARHEWLDLYLFESIEQAQELATKWLWTYNNERPHTSIGGVPPRQLLKAA